MSWIEKLYETYEKCHDAPQFEEHPLNPVSTTPQNTQIEITLDGAGNFRHAEFNECDVFIPVSEDSAARSGREPHPNPLSDMLKHCAGDIGNYGENRNRHAGYLKQLKDWCQSAFADPKARAVLYYVQKQTLTADLLGAKVLRSENGKLARIRLASKNSIAAADAWIRWRVEIPGEPQSKTWEDPQLFANWAAFESSLPHAQGVCAVTGKPGRYALKHPRAIRYPGDKAKLISSNDKYGFTYLGTFTAPDQAATVSYDVTQKAHNALRWLIKRQGTRIADERVYVAWAVSGAAIPDPFADTDEALKSSAYMGDAGQHYALRLRDAIHGYSQKLNDSEDVVIMGVDSATQGRMAIIYYRELTASDFLKRIEDWHTNAAWPQRYSKHKRFNGAPSPKDIAETVAARSDPRTKDAKLQSALVARLIPCIIDGRPVPRDIVESASRRALKRKGPNDWDWEKSLGIACALFKALHKPEPYQMSLEENRTTRDYLFGRLLAIADNLEQRALHLAGEKRDTSAGRLLQRFADHPASTWRTIELALTPYKARLRSSRPGMLHKRDKLLDRVLSLFDTADFLSDAKLSAEFLLGYHCQREALWKPTDPQGQAPAQGDSN